jgi:hypothetical protein
MAIQKSDGFWGGGNIIGKLITASPFAKRPQSNNEFEQIANSLHPTLKARREQIGINLLGVDGGRRYVEARLSRFSAETKIEWEGGNRADGSKVTGRKDRSHNVPTLGRLVSKVNQYVFSEPPVRDGAEPDVIDSITNAGQSVDDLMKRVNRYVIAAGWCWLGVDAPDLPEGMILDAETKSRYKIRPYWKLYSPLDVVNWSISPTGFVNWCITQGHIMVDGGPRVGVNRVKVRILWEPGKVTVYNYSEDGKTITDSQSIDTKLDFVPLFPVGLISDEPMPFDDLESINRSIMDLESCNRENYFKAVYPQRYMPASAIENANQAYNKEGAEIGAAIVGLGYPILINPDDKEPGIIMPPADALKGMRDEITSLKGEMYETFGFALRHQTRQVESAEAKAWDHLDVEKVMRESAQRLEAAEKKAVEMSVAYDSEFPAWEPSYNTTFDIGDFTNEIQGIVMASAVSMPDSMARELRVKLLDRIDRIGARIEPEVREQILSDLSTWGPVADMQRIVNESMAGL